MTLQSPNTSYDHQNDDDWEDEDSWDEEQPRVIYPDEVEAEEAPARGSRYIPREEPTDPSHSNNLSGSDDDWGDEEDQAHISLRPSSVSPSSLPSQGETANQRSFDEDWEESDESEGSGYGRHRQTPGEIDASESERHSRGGKDHSHSSSNPEPYYATQRQSRAPPEPLQAAAARPRGDGDDSFDEELDDNSRDRDGYGGYHRDNHAVPTKDCDDESFSTNSSGGFDKMVDSVLDESAPRSFDEEVQQQRQSHYRQTSQRHQGEQSRASNSSMGWSDEGEEPEQTPVKRSTRPQSRASEFHNPQAANDDQRRAALAKAKAMSTVYLYLGIVCIVLGLVFAIAAIALKDKGRS